MTQPFFTTNDSEIPRLEGLYVKERNPPAQVSGIFLGAVGIVGECVRGPVDTVVEITSEARFKEVFGGRDYGSGGTIIGKVWQALLNKPFGRLYVVRAAAAAAVKASFTVETAAGGGGTAIARIDASSVGAWGNDVSFKVSAATDGNANHWNLTVKYLGNTTTYKNLDTTTGVDNTLEVLGDDYGNLITITKLADGRPVNHSAGVDGADSDGYVNLGESVASFTSVAGTQGSIADSDFTGTGKGMELLAAYKGIGVCMIAERSSAALKTKWATLAGTSIDRVYLIEADTSATSLASAVTDAALNRSDRLIYCFNHPKTLDPETATTITVSPNAWMASILSQTDVDIHPGDEDNKALTAGITGLTYGSMTREDYITAKEAGIAALESDEGYAFVSGVTTSLTPGKEQITRRRMTDYLQLSIARTLKYSVNKKNTEARRDANKAMIEAFLDGLKKDGRIVSSYQVDTDSLNTEAQRALGIEKILLRVKLIGHMLHLVLETEIGTGVSVTEIV